MAGARVLARRASRPGALIAARRLADDPRAAFRAVSGLVLALFITTVAVAVITTQNAKDLRADRRRRGRQRPGGRPGRPATARPLTAEPSRQWRRRAPPPAALLARLRQIDGVQGVIEVRADPRADRSPATQSARSRAFPAAAWSRAPSSRRVPALGRCPAGAAAVAFPPVPEQCPAGHEPRPESPGRPRTSPAAQLDGLGAGQHRRRDERIRSQRSSRPGRYWRTRTPTHACGAPNTLGEAEHARQRGRQRLPAARRRGDPDQPADRRLHAGRERRGRAGRPQAPVQPAAAHRRPARHAAPRDRAGKRRPAAGRRRGRDRHRVRRLRDVRDSVQLQHSLVAPGAAYYLLTAAGIVVALGIIAATFPLLRRITGPETARSE